MKVISNKSVLIYDYNASEFKVNMFSDKANTFKQHFNNFIQVNYPKNEQMFILTGSTSQKFFLYDLSSNDMSFVNNLKFNHNWWPCIIFVENNSGVILFCISGTYTNKCEKLILNSDRTNLEWQEIASTNAKRGQASSILVNNSDIMIFFGYDCRSKSLATIEKYNNTSNEWINIEYNNKDNISSYLYYHANLHVNNNKLFILGGMIDESTFDAMYAYDLDKHSLNKTKLKMELYNLRFYNEKSFILLNSLYNFIPFVDEMKSKIDEADRLKDSLDFKKDDPEEPIINEGLLKGDKFPQNGFLYGLFDVENNLHLVKFNKEIKYEVIRFNNQS